jgi:hypothetical protein
MGGLFGGSPPSRDTLLILPEGEAADSGVPLFPPADTTFHQALRRFGLLPDTENVLSDFGDVHAPNDQLVQLAEPLRERQDDSPPPLPLPATPRPNLVRLDNVPITPGSGARPYAPVDGRQGQRLHP